MKTGQVYTPPKLADLITQLTFVGKLNELKNSLIQDKVNNQRFNQILKDFKDFSMLDPACGEGIFLTSAYKYLKREFTELLEKKQLEGSKKTIIRDFAENIQYRLYGVDIDKLAVDKARNNLHNECNIFSSALSQQIQVVNFLDKSIANVFQRWNKPRFQFIIGNPPFIDILNLKNAQKARLRSNFKSLSKRFDIYIPFLEQAINFLEPNGTIAFILPSSILYESYAGKIRKLILEKLNIKCIFDLSKFNLFPVAVRTLCLILEQRKENPVNHKVKILQPSIHPLQNIEFSSKQFFIPQIFFNGTYDYQFRLVEEKIREIGEKILSRSIKLGTILVTAWGARGTPIKDFHFNDPINNKCRRLVKGEDIITSPFPHVRYQNRWLLYDRARLYRPSLPSLFTQKKIVIRKVTGSAGLIAALDNEFFYTDDSVICGVLKNQLVHIPISELGRHKIVCTKEDIALSRSYSLESILALLNSDVGQFYFNNFLSHKLNVYPKLVEEFPVPLVKKQSSFIQDLSHQVHLLLGAVDDTDRKTKDLIQIKKQINKLVLSKYDFSDVQKQIIQQYQSPSSPE
ncbi:MAG: Eco57I restriction-modification methylase domain-containing protein [Promethearchaeota archaeon]